MNEFPKQGHERADTPVWHWLERSSRPARPTPPPVSVQVRLVWNGSDGEIEGVRVGNLDRGRYTSVRPTGRVAADFRQAFAQFLAENFVAAVWPGPSAGLPSPVSSTEPLAVAEEVLDPRLLAAELVQAIVQVAAFHAGIPILAARAMGQVAKDLFVSFSSPDPNAPKVRAVQCLDLTLSVKNGSLINSPALREINVAGAADVIDKLLDPNTPSSPPPVRPVVRRPPPEPAKPRPASTRPTDPAPPPRPKPGHGSGPRPQSPPAPSPGTPRGT